MTPDGICPTPDMVKSIQDLPRLVNITGVRSFFGLIEQVSFSFSKAHCMEPFRNLLSSKMEFAWNEDLQRSFEVSKNIIIDSASEGVKINEHELTTALISDWSKVGIGYMLLEKRCKCMGVSVEFCKTG